MVKSAKKTVKQPLRRYTNLASLIHILTTKKITLLDPINWDDGNDIHFMSEYKRLRRKKTILALCFAETFETYHHWKVFSSGFDGVCIEFEKDPLLRWIALEPKATWGSVKYSLIESLMRRKQITADELPFLKRRPYKDEKEFRIIYSCNDSELATVDIPIELSCIRRITLSPWMPPALRSSIVNCLKSINGCEDLSIVRSTLVGNSRWKQIPERAI